MNCYFIIRAAFPIPLPPCPSPHPPALHNRRNWEHMNSVFRTFSEEMGTSTPSARLFTLAFDDDPQIQRHRLPGGRKLINTSSEVINSLLFSGPVKSPRPFPNKCLDNGRQFQLFVTKRRRSLRLRDNNMFLFLRSGPISDR